MNDGLALAAAGPRIGRGTFTEKLDRPMNWMDTAPRSWNDASLQRNG
jgi:hypothetical protein